MHISPTDPKPSPKPLCAPGQGKFYLQVASVHTSKPQPSCGPEQIISPTGSCVYPTNPTPGPQPSCGPGKILSSSGVCIYPPRPTSPIIPTTPKPCPPGSKPSAFGTGCEYPRPTTPKPTETSPGYFYPKPTTPFEPKPQCPFGTRLGPSGSCEEPSISTTTPSYEQSCPPGLVRSPSGSCVRPGRECPVGTIRSPTGSCIRPTTPEYTRPCPSGTTKLPSGECKPKPQCPPGTSSSPFGTCTYPSPTPGRPTDTSTQVIPSYPSKKPYRPPATEDGYHYDKPTPTFGYPTTEHQGVGTNIDPAVRLPDKPDNEGEPANTNNIFVSTTRRPATPPPYYGEENSAIPAGCAAALKCVQEIYCTADGQVSPVPVVLTQEQELLRVPTTVCRDIESGTIGKCCRDPSYKDPWPSANLVDGFDDGQYKEDNLYGQREISSNRLARAPNNGTRGRRPARNSAYVQNTQSSQPTCGERHLNTKPPGSGPLDANFAEYPWQAMVLRDTNRSLLCGGAIIRRDAVLTAAHCVERLETSDILIKGGEWKLGIDDEPLPFQIVKVSAIIRHPDYKTGSYQNDMAVLVLSEKLRVAKNVGTICLPQPNQVSVANCKVTGWGKRILQLHAKGAIMHHIDVKIMDNQQCQQTLAERFQDSVQNYSPNTLCGYSDISQCRVDYGSALACANEQGQYTLSGIFSWDTGCKQEGQIGGYIAPDVEWIEGTLAKPLKELTKLDREYLLKNRK
ncbi:hypothetical protein JTB14_017257 [Gonioctena quinquepunctata]|nr:hypothetical protein JTB14_017257 [Gonioctena quinquepunctata]